MIFNQYANLNSLWLLTIPSRPEICGKICVRQSSDGNPFIIATIRTANKTLVVYFIAKLYRRLYQVLSRSERCEVGYVFKVFGLFAMYSRCDIRSGFRLKSFPIVLKWTFKFSTKKNSDLFIRLRRSLFGREKNRHLTDWKVKLKPAYRLFGTVFFKKRKKNIW